MFSHVHDSDADITSTLSNWRNLAFVAAQYCSTEVLLQRATMNETEYEIMRADSLRRLLVQSGSAVFMLITGLIGSIANIILIYVIVVRKRLHTRCWTLICQVITHLSFHCAKGIHAAGRCRLDRVRFVRTARRPQAYNTPGDGNRRSEAGCVLHYRVLLVILCVSQIINRCLLKSVRRQGASLTLAISIAVERLIATAAPMYYQSSMTRYSIAACIVQ